jgi:hypothetical protein
MKLNTLRLAGVLCTLAAATATACADNGVLPETPALTSITVAAEENRAELPVGHWDGILFASQALGGNRLRNVSVDGPAGARAPS